MQLRTDDSVTMLGLRMSYTCRDHVTLSEPPIGDSQGWSSKKQRGEAICHFETLPLAMAVILCRLSCAMSHLSFVFQWPSKPRVLISLDRYLLMAYLTCCGFLLLLILLVAFLICLQHAATHKMSANLVTHKPH